MKYNESGYSLVEVLVAVAILGVSIFSTMELATTKTVITQKTEASQGARMAEDLAVSTVEIAGLGMLSLKSCGTSGNTQLNQAFAAAGSSMKFKDLSAKDYSALPKKMADRCKGGTKFSNRGFNFCKKLATPSPGDKSYLDGHAVIIEGVYLFKNSPKKGSYVNCTNADFDDLYQQLGGDFFYSIAHIKKTDLKKGKKFVVKKRYRYLRADKYLSEVVGGP